MILDFIRSHVSTQNPLLLTYHRVIGFLAAVFFGFPARKLKVIAVTGTKGKTTTCHMIARIFEAAGFRIGMATSIDFQIGEKIWPNSTKQTTLGRFQTQRLLSSMKKSQCEVVILEVSSHALTQSRIFGIPIHTAVLTNLLGDHIEYHGSFDAYREAKLKLFSKNPAVSVLPLEEPNFPHFEKLPAKLKMTFGMQSGSVHTHEVEQNQTQTSFKLHFETPYKNEQISVALPLPGDANIRNALAAAAAAAGWKIPLSKIKEGLEKTTGMPGRYEEIREGQNFSVIVDYAHTPESLEEIAKFYRTFTRGNLILVFGATGGGRDKEKRPRMGAVAEKYADIIILTDDDPYEENRREIIEMIAKGIHGKKENETLWKIIDRREAIEKALSLAQKGDTVVIAGKGCESVIMIGRKRVPWDDRDVARTFLRRYLRPVE